jgi:hypothetical protein
MKIIKLKINAYVDRERIITALANSGYHVWVEEMINDNNYRRDFFVCFEEYV